jgi:hypothetical protein
MAGSGSEVTNVGLRPAGVVRSTAILRKRCFEMSGFCSCLSNDWIGYADWFTIGHSACVYANRVGVSF